MCEINRLTQKHNRKIITNKIYGTEHHSETHTRDLIPKATK